MAETKTTEQVKADTAVELPPMPLTAEGKVYREFESEVNNHLDRLEVNLLLVEGEPATAERIEALARGLQLIRGQAATLRLMDIERCAGEAEGLTMMLQRGDVIIDDQVVEVLRQGIELIRRLVAQVVPAVKSLRLLARTSKPQLFVELMRQLTVDKLLNSDGEPAVALPPVPPKSEEGPIPRLVDALTVARCQYETMQGKAAELRDVVSMMGEEAALQGDAGADLRVHLHRLGQVSKELTVLTQAMGRVASATLLPALRRCVHDAAKSHERSVSFALDGGDTMIDMDLAAAIQQPLAMLLQATIAGSIESPSERAARGKNRDALVTLGVVDFGGMPRLTIVDDGCGLEEETLASARAPFEALGARTEYTSTDQGGYWTMSWPEEERRGKPVAGIRDVRDL